MLAKVLRSMSLGFVFSLFATATGSQSVVDRGHYLATLGDCVVCHTAPRAAALPFAGGYPLHAIFGTVYSTNITPDKQTGIGDWTSDQFFRALHDGVAADGHHLYPAFPYAYFRRISRADSDALFAYLRTVQPQRYRPPANRLMFPTNIRWLMVFWNALFLPQSRSVIPTGASQWRRGEELVNSFGHCGGCHTPKTLLFSDEPSAFLHGDLIDGWFAPNLTGSQRTGLGKWTAQDITEFLKTGSNRFGRVTGSMQGVIKDSTSHWTENDRLSVAVYLKSLPAEPEDTPLRPDPQAMHDGERIFVERCSVCHSADTKDYPPLGGNGIVQASDPATVLRVILRGSQSTPTPGGPVGFSMPAFPGLTDRELADVATYVRNSWGNRASPVAVDDAKTARHVSR